MTFAQAWLRQAFGAAGASLLVPLAVLVAAGALAAGGGLAGLSDLGQITSGPTLPGGDLTAGDSGIADADIVGADIASVPAAGSPAASGGGVAGALGSAGAVGAPQTTIPGSVPSPLTDLPSPPGGGGTPGTRPVVPPVQQAPVSPPAADPVQELVENTRGGIETVVPEPIQPVTEDLINLLLPPRQP